jgi:hypothetical protein
MAALRDEVTSALVDAFGQHGGSWARPARAVERLKLLGVITGD